MASVSSESQFSLCVFEVTVGPSVHADGHSVHVVGDHPALGCWDSACGVPLHATAAGGWQLRVSAPVSIPSGVALQYKYIVIANGQLQRWEAIQGNRVLVPDRADVVARDELDRYVALPLPRLEPPLPPLPPTGASLAEASLAPEDHGGSTVLIVTYILPLVIRKDEGEAGGWTIAWNQDAITAKKRPLEPHARVQRIGCPGLAVAEEDRASLTAALSAYGCVPIFLDAELDHSFYFGFCRSYLWPTFHNVIKARGFNDKVWRAYCAANRRFADKVIEVYDSGDLVWVHDYHLLLLPSYILRKLRTARVGLFLHTPFPSSEIFRTIPVREELIRGMLNADLIGFHIFEYARHFLTCCKRMLGLEYEFHPGGFIAVRDYKRDVKISVSHVGIEPELCRVEQAAGEAFTALAGGAAPPMPWACAGFVSVSSGVSLSSPVVANEEARKLASNLVELRQLQAAGKTVMLGIDEMERLKGIPLKLIAFEQLLKTVPERADKVALVQVGVRARNFTPAVQADFDELRGEVLEILGRIESAFPGAVRFVEVPTMALAQRMQLWALADVAVFTPVREGFNSFPLEAVYARREGTPGVVLLSEFCSTACVLNGALRINPWNTEEVTHAMECACSMRASERLARHERDMQFIVQTTASAWAERFANDLQTTSKKPDEPWTPIGFGLAGFRRVGWGEGFRALDTTEVLAAYRRARRRAIFLDWGGTLVAIDNGQLSSLISYYHADLPPAVHHCLEELAADPSNLLMVLSGRERSRVEEVFKGIGGASLAAEHGFHFRLGSFPGVRKVGEGAWQQLFEDFDLSWKETVRAIFEAYKTRTNGVVIQDKGSALVWKYDEVDPEFASMQLKELLQHLHTTLQHAPVEVTMGKGYLEVRAKGMNKGVIVDHIISLLYSNCGGVDFVLCIGDDTADESMFSALQSRFGSSSQGGGPSVFTTVVGRKPSAANYYLNDPDEVLELCQSLRLHSTRANRNRSMGDLQRLHSDRSWTVGKPRGASGGGAGPGGGAGAGAMGAQRGGTLDWSRMQQPSGYYSPSKPLPKVGP